MPNKRPPKKSDMLEVRIPHDTKRAFLDACREVGRTASDVVREFVDSYLRRAARRRSSKLERSIAMIMSTSPLRGGAIAAGAAALGLMIAVGLTPSSAQPDLGGVFASLDVDGDGRLALDEFSERRASSGVAELSQRWVSRNGPSHTYVEDWWVVRSPALEGSTAAAGDELVIRISRTLEGAETVERAVAFIEDGAELLAELRLEEFEKADRDGSASVDLAEFEARYTEAISEGFAHLDENGDDRISADEYSPGLFSDLRTLGVHGAIDPGSEQGFRRLDANGDGELTLEEFSVGS